MFISELAEPQLLVIYPGRFHPFHKGHHAVYDWLTSKFGRNNVYIATSDKVDGEKSPFSFAEKAYFMQLTGVPSDRIVQASQPYNIQNVLTSGQITVADPSNTVVIFAVSEKDMAEDPRFSFAPKKDGTPPYFQPLKDIKQTESMNQHGYILTVPTFQFNVLNKPMQSASELRAQYKAADEKTRQAIVKDLFGKYTREAEQIMNNKLSPAAPVVPPRPNKAPKMPKAAGELAEGQGAADARAKELITKARALYPFADSDEQALAMFVYDQEKKDVSRLDREQDHDNKMFDELSNFKDVMTTELALLRREIASLKEKISERKKISEDAAGVGQIATAKQKNDPRYKNSLTVDVRPDTPAKNMQALHLIKGKK